MYSRGLNTMVAQPKASTTRDPSLNARKLLTIRQEARVGWFAVRQLLATATMAATATVVGSMTGRRELMAALDPRISDRAEIDHDYSEEEEIWVDYVADTGDGWDATLSVAWLIGRNALNLRRDCKPTPQAVPKSDSVDDVSPSPRCHLLKAGRVLILGGDVVYPCASSAAYQSRLVDPFQSARFYEAGGGRHVFAIPGNHDWYDGLTAFIRQFCQTRQRWIGAWRTQQKRSYFAIRLPYSWWLWGVDMALEEDLDPPQLDYFNAQSALLQPRDKVILCVPLPTWARAASVLGASIDSGAGYGKIDRALQREVRKLDIITDLVSGTGARIALYLAGDLHHYTRHEGDGTNYVICGGGGAFTLGTSAHAKRLDLEDRTVTLRKSFPSDAESRALRWRALAFPVLSPGFTAVLTGYQLLLAYALNLTTRSDTAGGVAQNWIQHLAETPLGWSEFYSGIVKFLVGLLLTAPFTLGLVVLFIGACVAFALKAGDAHSRRYVLFILGFLHAVLQLTVGIVICWDVAQLAGPETAGYPLTFSLFAGCLIFVVSGVLFGAYLVLTNVIARMHEQEVFSCQSLEQFKSFLRIHISPKGAVLYPVGLRKSHKRWRFAPGVTKQFSSRSPDTSLAQTLSVPENATRLFDPATPLAPQLIEKPIRIG
jgi:hypothetical protein